MPRLQPSVTYVLPIRSSVPRLDADFRDYLGYIAGLTEVVVVDGSSVPVFEEHARTWGRNVLHIRPHADLATPMGKVGGVLTGMRVASNSRIIIADDDIRYDEDGIAAVANALDNADVVRPQNYFSPRPWHALWDSGRILLNRISGGDWPGTLGVQRERVMLAGGYDGTAMFENLELVRTVLASGGRECLLLDTFVARRPSTTRHFLSQRVRQAYDEFARPARLLVQLALLPIAIIAFIVGGWHPLGYASAAIIALAEIGRRRGSGANVFPFTASLIAPAWVIERAICAWLALGARVFLGGVPYRGAILRKAATPLSELRARVNAVPQDLVGLAENLDVDGLEGSIVR
ncbi:MAG: glycosyltransferase family 2 protein [Gemmatimonadaceae bacterium]|nr:glycosyltransferase family 2 protein [Gemmatimonadaceae bacterium]